MSTAPVLMSDADLAAHLAEVAGKLLVQVRESALLSLKALGKAGCPPSAPLAQI